MSLSVVLDGAAAGSLGAWVDRDPRAGGSPTTLPRATWEGALWAPIRDILDRPSKGFRARLAEAGFRLIAPARRPPPELGAALEILHAGSLVVDDIEDASTERRGAPTLHRVYGLPRALNAGSFMYFWALDLLGRLPLSPTTSRRLGARALATLMDCHRGQALDLTLAIGQTPQAEIPLAVEETTRLKTGALCAFALHAGAVAAGADVPTADAAARFGVRFGAGLQQLDDLGNLAGRQAPGKRHEDLRAGRLTWPFAWAAETLSDIAFARLESAARQVAGARSSDGGERAAAELARELQAHAGLHRRKHIVAELDAALAELESAVGRSPVTRELAEEIARLGVSYG